MSMENILELQQVSKTFSKSNFALENVTFSLPYGSILGFVGGKRSRKNYNDWLYSKYNRQRQRNGKVVWKRNDRRRYRYAGKNRCCL